jgi:hypothetical protein
MVAAVILISMAACVFGIFYLYLTTRNRERMAMIDKGADPGLFAPAKTPQDRRRYRYNSIKFTLKSGMLIIGVGVGFIISVLFNNWLDRDIYPLLVVGIVFVCGGAGLVSGFYMGRHLEKKDLPD